MMIRRRGSQLVHISHGVQLDGPIDRFSSALVSAPREWFPRSIGVHIAGIPVRKRVAVEFGDAVKTTTWAVVRVNWKATFPRRLFPAMEGKVSLSSAGKTATKLTVSGMYEPPLGRLGESLNEAVMHKVAEQTLRELAESISARLRRRAGRAA